MTRHDMTTVDVDRFHEGGSAAAEAAEMTTGLNAEAGTLPGPALPVVVRDSIRTRPMRARRFVTDSLGTDAMLTAPVRIVEANPARRRVVVQADAGGGLVRIGSDATVASRGVLIPPGQTLEILADGDVWAQAGTAGFVLGWFAEFDD